MRRAGTCGHRVVVVSMVLAVSTSCSATSGVGEGLNTHAGVEASDSSDLPPLVLSASPLGVLDPEAWLATATTAELEIRALLDARLAVEESEGSGQGVRRSDADPRDDFAPVALRSATSAAPLRAVAESTPGPVEVASTLGVATIGGMLGAAQRDLDADRTVGEGFDHPGRFRTTTVTRAAARDDLDSTLHRIDQTIATHVDASFDLDVCPDANGVVDGAVEFDVRVDLTDDAGTRSGSYHVAATFSAPVDDAAWAGEVSFDVVGSVAVSSAPSRGTPDRSGSFLELHLVGTQGVNVEVGGLSTAEVLRSSRSATGDQAQSLSDALYPMTAGLTAAAVAYAQRHWRSGRCVELLLEPDAGPDGIVPEQRIGVRLTAKAVLDGLSAGGVVTATLSAGGDTVEPDGIAQPLPATVTYIAPPVSGGTVSAESVSRRGIGRGSVTFTAAPGWVVDAGDGVFHIRSVKCDGTGGRWRFELDATFDGAQFHGEVVADIDDATLSGPFTLTGAAVGGGLTIPQRGSGTITIAERGDTATITFSADSWSSGQTGGGRRGPGTVTAQRATREDCP